MTKIIAGGKGFLELNNNSTIYNIIALFNNTVSEDSEALYKTHYTSVNKPSISCSVYKNI